MPTEVGLPLALVAGLLSFLSPCVVPLVPGYLAFVSGVAASDAHASSASSSERILLGTILFVLGFTAVFVALGTVAAAFGGLFDTQRPWLSRIAGGLMIVMGLIVLGLVRWSRVWQEWRLLRMPQPAGPLGALGLGAAFGLSWTPCIGPVLASILALAGTSGHLEEGALLMFGYSIGLGTPFLVASVMLSRITPALQRVRRYYGLVNTVSGLALLGLGTLFLFNQSFYLSIATQRLAALTGQ